LRFNAAVAAGWLVATISVSIGKCQLMCDIRNFRGLLRPEQMERIEHEFPKLLTHRHY